MLLSTGPRPLASALPSPQPPMTTPLRLPLSRRGSTRKRLIAATAVLCAAAIANGAMASTVCPPQGDQLYAFSGGPDTVTATVALQPARSGSTLRWPKLPAQMDSALAWVALEPTTGPVEVVLSAGAVSSKQTFAEGTSGWRALNATAFIDLASGSPVFIAATGARFARSEAQVQAFANGLPLEQRILVLAAHPDDAEMAAFGLYAGRQSTIVTVTAGNAGDFNYCESVSEAAAHYRLKGRLRTIDSVTIPWQGQIPVERTFNLGYFDARLEAMLEQPSQPVREAFIDNDNVLPYRSLNQGRLLPVVSRKATWTNLVEDMRNILLKVRPQIVVTADPRLDMHRDHQLTTVAFARALAQTTLSPKVLLYTNHADRNLYPRGPAGQDAPLPPWCGQAPLQAESFFALPLNQELQTAKLMALESMHDMRMSPTAQFPFGWQPQEACKHVPPLPAPEETPLRNAIRPFEFFFVVDRPLLMNLAEAAAKVR